MNKMEAVLYAYNVIDPRYVKDKFKLNCPFHHDKTPSMVINLKKEYFRCYGCGVSGGPKDFVDLAEEDKNSFEKLLLYKKILNENIDKKIENKVEVAQDIEQETFIKNSKDFYKNCFEIDWTEKPNHYIVNRGYNPFYLNKLGVKIAPSYDYPLTIPLYDNFEFVGIIRRTISGADPKYMYEPGFKKSINLYGKYFEDYLIITEGILDQMKLEQNGIKNCVAIFGWDISDTQIKKVHSVAFNVISALDNDEKGFQGTLKMEEYFNVIRFPFPDNVKDIGDMTNSQIKRSKKELKKIIRRDKNGKYA